MKTLKLFGKIDSPPIYTISDFLQRSKIDFDCIDTNEDLCKIEFSDGTTLINPTTEQIANHLGWIKKPGFAEYDLSIYGAGPAGLSAAVYAASEGLRTILIEREAIGGQAGTSSLIENYMGFPEGIEGAELAERARQQALKFGVEILLMREGIKAEFFDNRIHVDTANGEKLVAKANICATGVEYARLQLEREEFFLHKGLYYGAGASEAVYCKDKDIYIIGGGNSAGQAAVYFSGFARNVFMIIRGGSLIKTLSAYLIKRIDQIANISVIYRAEVKELDGDKTLSRIKIHYQNDQTRKWHNTSKLFVCIGGNPNTDWAIETAICRDKNGYLITGTDLIGNKKFENLWKPDRRPFHLETSVPGSFAAGDVRYNSVKRVAAAVGEGAMAVTQVHQYLANL